MRAVEPFRAFALRFVLSASAALPVALAEQLERMLGVPVLQGYGMTETGVVAQNPLPPGRFARWGRSACRLATNSPFWAKPAARLPTGEMGEIIVRGPEVFAGYEERLRRATARRSSKAGSVPAIWATSMTTGSCSSTAA